MNRKKGCGVCRNNVKSGEYPQEDSLWDNRGRKGKNAWKTKKMGKETGGKGKSGFGVSRGKVAEKKKLGEPSKPFGGGKRWKRSPDKKKSGEGVRNSSTPRGGKRGKGHAKKTNKRCLKFWGELINYGKG